MSRAEHETPTHGSHRLQPCLDGDQVNTRSDACRGGGQRVADIMPTGQRQLDNELAFRRGHTPETITEQYPSLRLDEVYLALGYYLLHRVEIDAYLREQEAEAEAFLREYEAHHPPTLTREVLLARLEAKRKSSGE